MKLQFWSNSSWGVLEGWVAVGMVRLNPKSRNRQAHWWSSSLFLPPPHPFANFVSSLVNSLVSGSLCRFWYFESTQLKAEQSY